MVRVSRFQIDRLLVLSGSHVHAFNFLYSQRYGKDLCIRAITGLIAGCRTRNAYCFTLLRSDSRDRILWLNRRRRVCRNGRSPWSRRLAMAIFGVGRSSLLCASNANNDSSEGAVTALVAIFGLFLLPNEPLTTSWLKPHEREMAHARMERDRVSDSTEPVSMMEGLRQACRDKRTWMFCLMQNFHLSACSFNSFFPTYVPALSCLREISHAYES